jgi:aspartate/glutamate racemase
MTTFGILGGQGAVATLRLHQLIIEQALHNGAVQDEDFPSLIVGSLSSSALSEEGVSNVDQVDKFIQRHADIFNGNVDKVIAPCNTLHARTEILESTFGKDHFVSILDIVADTLPSNSKILVLGSITTKQEKLFERNNKKNNTFVYADPKVATDLILAGMSNTTHTPLVEKDLVRVTTQFRKENCDVILLGCTDLSVLASSYLLAGLTVIDALTEVANYIIEENIINAKDAL